MTVRRVWFRDATQASLEVLALDEEEDIEDEDLDEDDDWDDEDEDEDDEDWEEEDDEDWEEWEEDDDDLDARRPRGPVWNRMAA